MYISDHINNYKKKLTAFSWSRLASFNVWNTMRYQFVMSDNFWSTVEFTLEAET